MPRCLMKLITALALVTLYSAAHAQGVPGTEIYLMPYEAGKFGKPENITNRPGYDNQPFFTQDSLTLLFTRIEDNNADIAAFDLTTRKTRQLTQTTQSEYSPTPFGNDGSFSVIQVEDDGTQRLWRFNRQGEKPELLFPDFAPVGYHTWTSHDSVAAFVLGEPHTLQLKAQNKPARIVAEEIGRGMLTHDGYVYFVKMADGSPMLARLALNSQKGTGDEVTIIAPMPGNGQDIAPGPAGSIWATSGNQLFCLENDEWIVAHTFENAGMQSLSRLAFSPDYAWFAVVGEEATSEDGAE